jgi:murein DD-endopeptidase MepM/ murein hydrolase activator NlpD
LATGDWQYGRVPGRLSRVLAPGLLAVVLAGGCAGPSAVFKAGASPAATEPSPSAAPSTAPAPGASVLAAPGASPAAQVHRVFPVAGKASYGHTHHDYPAADIFAACGSAVRSPVDGVVLEVSRVDDFDPKHPAGEDKGGLSVSIRGDDGVRYYGSHLAAVQNGLGAGTRVRAGTQVGLVGKTGNSSNVCHLHFGLSPVCAGTGDWWVRRGVFYPWKYLDSWRADGNLSPVDEAAAWRRAHGCPTAPTPGTR